MSLMEPDRPLTQGTDDYTAGFCSWSFDIECQVKPFLVTTHQLTHKLRAVRAG